MPRLVEAVLECSLYLYPTVDAAKGGEGTGGSGFLFGIESSSGDQFLYAVSNSHVVRSNPAVRLNTKDGKFDVLPLTADQWQHHPDGETDLAAVPIDFIAPAKYRALAIGYPHLLTKELIPKFDIGIGDDLFLVGRFIDREGVQCNEPTVRFGAIAQMPGQQPIKTKVGNQDAFLAEIRSISGYSGSPVFALIPRHRDPTLSKKQREELTALPKGIGGKERILFIGVDCGHMRFLDPDSVYEEIINVDGDREARPIENLWINVNSGMAIVTGAWKLHELLKDHPELKKMREDEIKRRRKIALHSKLDSAGPRIQKTHSPKEEDRIDVPIPTRGQFERDLAKATRKRDK